ncbi:MAG: DUF559 domain-containing protein [Acidimicrobiales bacterium]
MPTAIAAVAIANQSRNFHGVLLGPKLRADLTQRQIDHACATGVLIRRFQDVYIDPAVPPSPLQDLAAAVSAAGRLAAASHRSAAALWGLYPEFPAVPEIVIPEGRRSRLDRVVTHRFSGLCADHLHMRSGIRVLNPLIAVIVLGSVVGPEAVAEVIIRADRRRLFRPIAIRAELERTARSGRDGVVVVRQALQMLPIGDRPTDGILELWFAELSRAHDVPAYEFQHRVVIAGERFRIDFAYPHVKLAIEVDDYETHGSLAGFINQPRRQNALVLDGWTILRFTWWDIKCRPAEVAAEVRSALRSLSHT